ncbi:MAG: hypothetical protein M1582_03990 [Actinobacteria bacterium]|nr:hypothetical protein [Actinomycetota bacterium]
MTQNDILLVAGMAGAAVLIVLIDLVLSLIRHRRRSRMRSDNSRLDRAPSDEAAIAAKSEWIHRRLTAIQNASNGTQRDE